jgi:hypothetical protein
VARWQAALVAVVIAVPAAVVASFVPYRHWDAQAFGLWSKLIATTGDLFPGGLSPAILHRPLFYIAQGLGWRWLDDGEWVGRWLSLLFAAALVAALWWLAGRLTTDGAARILLRPLAVSVALASSALALYLVAGLSDLPVAATAALTAVAAWSRVRPSLRVPLVAAASCATILAKPSGFVAVAGVAAGTAVLLSSERRRLLTGLVAMATGAAVGLAYHLAQAHRLGISLQDELSSGNSEFYLERGAAARTDALLRAEWLGAGVRLVVLAGVLFSVARVAGARPRLALAIAGPGAVCASILGPVAAGDGVPYPFAGPSWLGVAGWLGLAAVLVGAAFLVRDDPVSRRGHAALLAWLLPGVTAWIAVRSDEVRFLSPAWPALVLVAAAVLGCAALALARARPWLALAPAAALTALVLANVASIDGLHGSGLRELAEQGPSGWTDRAAMENFAYGPFADELALIRRNVGSDGRIVSSDARLPYFFPNGVRIRYPVSCADVAEARVFVLLLGDESVEFMRRAGGPPDPLAWEQCSSPRVTVVGSQDGIYAAFVVGDPPRSPAVPSDCRVTGTPGTLLDGVFVADVPYREARAIRERAAAVGYEAARIERTGCGQYRVVVTGIPTPRANQEDFLRESSGAGFHVDIRQPVRYPEVPADVEPAPPSR